MKPYSDGLVRIARGLGSSCFLLLPIVLLIGCTTLPERQDEERYLALVLENGGLGPASDASPYLVSNLSEEPLRLRSGINFLLVPPGTEPLRLRSLNISPPNPLEPPYRSGYLGYEIKRPAPGTIVLVAKKLRYFARSNRSGGQVVFETDDLSEAEVARILNSWNETQKKEGRPWLPFEVARPETTLF